jgi:hypothetical protein
MGVNILIPEELHKALMKHLFKGSKEQGAFLFATDSTSSLEMNLKVEDIYLIPPEAWDAQESYYLELSEEEKVKVMIMARRRDCNLIECHSHRSPYGMAYFSPSDIHGLEEFISYVRWKLPRKKYGALVWTKSSVYGQVWDPNNPTPIPVGEVRIIRKDGIYRIVKPSVRKRIFSWSVSLLKRGTNEQ